MYREALNEIYVPRIQRGNVSFAANILGARGALLSVLVHFFEQGRWGSFVQPGIEGHSLTAEDQLFVLTEAGRYLTATRESAPEVRICYERAAALCHLLNRPLDLYVALMGQWRYFSITDTQSATMQLARRVYALAQEQNDPTLLVGACTALAVTLYHFRGDFEAARQYTMQGIELWRSGRVRSLFEEVDSQPVACLCVEGLLQWQFGEIPSCRATIAEAISLAKELNDMHGLAVALSSAARLAYFERSAGEVERLASDLIELSTRHGFAHWPAIGEVFRGWARSASGGTAEGLSWIEDGIEDYRASGSLALMPYLLTLKAEALDLADRTSEALDAIKEAEKVVERSEGREWCAELHRLHGVFLAAIGADQKEIEASFREAIRIAKEQKSVSLEKRAKATYAEYRRQKASGSGGRGFRLPLC